jgi:hypothetical protein
LALRQADVYVKCATLETGEHRRQDLEADAEIYYEWGLDNAVHHRPGTARSYYLLAERLERQALALSPTYYERRFLEDAIQTIEYKLSILLRAT